MTDNIITISNGITLGATEVRERVRKLLSVIPKNMERTLSDLEMQQFYGLRLRSPEGHYFILSMQGSGTHYCEPKRNLSNLAEYSEVEVGIVPDERNRPDRYRFGTTYDYKAEARIPIKEGEVDSFGRSKRGWLTPADIGFTRVEENPHDDVLGWVPVSDLVDDLADFFLRGGVIEGDHTDTKEWLAKLGQELEG